MNRRISRLPTNILCILTLTAAALSVPVQADHIAAAALTWEPVTSLKCELPCIEPCEFPCVPPARFPAIRFRYDEVASGLCCYGGLEIDYGDGARACLADHLNQTTPAGTYASTCDDTSFAVAHPTPVTTSVTFVHHYAPGVYVVRWTNCCANLPPPVPSEVSNPVRMALAFAGQFEPVGQEVGTTYVVV